MKDETFELFQCDFMVLQPFQIIIDEEQYKYLLSVLESEEKLINKKELNELAKKLRIKENKARQTQKKTYLKIIPLSCEHCYKYTVCPKYSTTRTRTEREKIAILNLNCQNQRQRKVLNLLNFNKPAGYYFSTRELTEEAILEITKQEQKERKKWEELKALIEGNKIENEINEKLRKKRIIGGSPWDF